MGVRGQAFRQVVKSLADAAEQSRNWLWIKTNAPTGLQNDQRGVKAEGGTSGTPGVAVEPFGGVMGLSTKHQ